MTSIIDPGIGGTILGVLFMAGCAILKWGPDWKSKNKESGDKTNENCLNKKIPKENLPVLSWLCEERRGEMILREGRIITEIGEVKKEISDKIWPCLDNLTAQNTKMLTILEQEKDKKRGGG